jgi:hypothetical protein
VALVADPADRCAPGVAVGGQREPGDGAQAKGKVERGIGDQRGADDPYGQVFDSLETL